MNTTLPPLKIGNFESNLPIIQGGMGVGISLAGLASAVSNNGGIGVISSIGLGLLYPQKGYSIAESNKIALRKEIKKAKHLTNSILGLNVMHALTDYEDIVKIAFEEEIELLFIGAGLPLKMLNNLSLDYLRNVKTKIIPIVSSSRAVNLIFKNWEKKFSHIPDAVVLEGPLAGGHLGFKNDQISKIDYSLERLLPNVIEIIKPFEDRFHQKIPIIVAGGIFTGADIYKFIRLGSDGVQMGTRFVATYECDASLAFKNQYVKCNSDDIGIIQSPVGLPGRSIINSFLRDAEDGKKKPLKCPFKCLKNCHLKSAPYCIALALINAQKGKLNKGFAFCGQNASKINKIISVEELMKNLIDEYEMEYLFNPWTNARTKINMSSIYG